MPPYTGIKRTKPRARRSLACELFLAHFVYQDLRNWLLTPGLTCVVGAAAHLVTTMQARTLAEENRDVARVLEPHRRYRAVFVTVIVIFCLCLWALYDVLHLGQVRLVIALVALIVVGGFVGSTVPYWNRVLAYAQGEHEVQRKSISEQMS